MSNNKPLYALAVITVVSILGVLLLSVKKDPAQKTPLTVIPMGTNVILDLSPGKLPKVTGKLLRGQEMRKAASVPCPYDESASTPLFRADVADEVAATIIVLVKDDYGRDRCLAAGATTVPDPNSTSDN